MTNLISPLSQSEFLFELLFTNDFSGTQQLHSEPFPRKLPSTQKNNRAFLVPKITSRQTVDMFFSIKQINGFTLNNICISEIHPDSKIKAHKLSKGIFLLSRYPLIKSKEMLTRSQPQVSSGIQICYANEFDLYNLKLFCEREILSSRHVLY